MGALMRPLSGWHWWGFFLAIAVSGVLIEFLLIKAHPVDDDEDAGERRGTSA